MLNGQSLRTDFKRTRMISCRQNGAVTMTDSYMDKGDDKQTDTAAAAETTATGAKVVSEQVHTVALWLCGKLQNRGQAKRKWLEAAKSGDVPGLQVGSF